MSENNPIERFAGYGADAVYDVFRVLSSAPTLPKAAADLFQTAELLGAGQTELLGVMAAAGVIRIDTQWGRRIDESVQLYRNRSDAEAQLTHLERQLKTIGVQLKHSAEKKDRGRLLKSKTTRWEETNQHEKLEKQQRALSEERRKNRAIIDGAEEAMEGLLSAIAATPELSKARWLGGQVVQVTNDGAFLASTLKAMNTEHFRGRRLCEILRVGPLLA